jgi:hypothetical protein
MIVRRPWRSYVYRSTTSPSDSMTSSLSSSRVPFAATIATTSLRRFWTTAYVRRSPPWRSSGAPSAERAPRSAEASQEGSTAGSTAVRVNATGSSNVSPGSIESGVHDEADRSVRRHYGRRVIEMLDRGAENIIEAASNPLDCGAS